MIQSFVKPVLLSAFLLSASMLLGQTISPKSIRTTTIKSAKFENAPRKIFIKTFKVYYQMIAEAEKTVYGGRQFGGGSYTGNATARLAVGVEGVSPEDLQQLTDELYNGYVRDLQGLGLEILTAKDINEVSYFEGWDMLEGPRINQEQIKGSLMVIPDGFSYKVKRVTGKGKEKTGGFMSGVTGINGAQAVDFSSSAYGPLPKVSDELDDIIVAEVVLNVPSIYLDPKSRLGTAKIKGGPYLRLGQAKATYLSGKLKKPGVASPNTMIETMLSDPIQIDGVFESEQFKAVATKSRTMVPDYAAFFTVENKTVELSNTISCDAEVYKAEVKRTLQAFIDLTLDKLTKGLDGEKVK
ncbi:MAG: hypothetical protein KI790_18335 [Cyclobacteriaceae bacterium]|nr:hypothetical protein [Cyclobacteriaceae bacterium HetDA_MAG_MS6]